MTARLDLLRGPVGPFSYFQTMRTFTDEQILAATEGLSSFQGWRKGFYFIAVRSDADRFDSFDDKAFLYEVKVEGERPEFILTVGNMTTNTGSYGLKHFSDYNHLGAAVLKADHMVYNSHSFGLHKGKESYRQTKGFDYYRDNNRNERAEEIGNVYTDIIYANIHRAGQNSTVIKNWSTACMVIANLNRFFEFINYMKKRGKPPLTLVILKESTAAASNVGDSADTTFRNTPNSATTHAGQSPLLKRRSKGAYVVKLQKRLSELGFNITVDGDFGSKTEQAVLLLQSQQGLKADGRVGPDTWKALGV